MLKQTKILWGVSILVFIVSTLISMKFGGYSSPARGWWAVLVMLVGVLVPFLTVVAIALYGFVGLLKKDYKRFLLAGSISLCLLISLAIFSFPLLLLK